MPKLLTKPQPSSSVIHFLEPHIGAAALARPEATITPQLVTPLVEQLPPPEEKGATVPKRTVLRQFKLPREADEVLQRVIAIFSESTGVDLKMTEVLCALLKGIESAIPRIEYEAKNLGTLKRPKNDPFNDRKKEEFLKEIARCFVAGMRTSSTMS